MTNGLQAKPLWGWTAAWLAALLALAVAGCEDTRRGKLGAGGPAYPVAVVNNEVIALEEFLDSFQLFLTRWSRFIQNDREKKDNIREIFLANMIDTKLLDQEARRRGIDVPAATVNAEILRLTAPWDEEQLVRAARDAHSNFETWQSDFRRRMVHQRLIEREVVDKISVTQRELRAYYERNRAEFVQPEQVRVRHIAVGSRSLFNRIVHRVDNEKAFINMVRKYSITPDREADGDLGFVQRGVLPAELDKAVFAMTHIGSTSPANKPVRTQIGYHIFRLEDRKPEAGLTFQQALPLIRIKLVREKQSAAYGKWMQTLREKATIRIDRKLLLTELG